MQICRVWQNAWKNGYDKPLELGIPDNWNWEMLEMPADRMPPLTKEQIRLKLRDPIGSPGIRELASRGKQAAIVFDDLTRGTQTKEIAELVVEELLLGGLPRENIRFICALGCHAPMTREDFVKKLGEEIVENYPVYNHNAFGNCVCVGVDKDGVPVEVNEEFMACDIRIGIGAVSPHPFNGFGGGAKLIFPGLASFRTTLANHGRREFGGAGSLSPCGFRSDVENMAAMTGPFFKIDVILNAHLDTVAVFAGEDLSEYREAARCSAVLNALPAAAEKDLVIVNANAKYNESLIAVTIASQILREGGDLVLINHCPAGQVTHYLYSAFGACSSGPLAGKGAGARQMRCGRLIYCTPYPDHTSRTKFSQPEKLVFAKSWDEVLAVLEDTGARRDVSLISDGSISYFPHVLRGSES